MGIRTRLTALVGGDELRERQDAMAQTVAALATAYDAGKYELPPVELMRQLGEYASTADLDFIMSLAGWEGNQLLAANIGQERTYAIAQSEHAWRHSPLYQWSVWAWTSNGLGESVKVVPVDDTAKETWDEFWSADRNASVLGQDKIQDVSDWLLVMGDRYLVYFASTVDGEATVRNIVPSQFPGPPITDPNDDSLPLFYKRVWKDSKGTQQTLYYPDWAAFFGYPEKLDQEGLLPVGAKRADRPDGEVIGNESPGTVAVIQHIAFNRKNESDLRGWPLGTVGLPYERAHEEFVRGRLAVSAAKQLFVRRKVTDAGSRGLASIKSTLQSSLATSGYFDTNPAPAPGGTELDNKAITTTDLPMTTGASDAKVDNDMFAWMALLGTGMLPTSAGLDTSRWATALTMDKNQAMLWSRYKSFMGQQFKNTVKIVLSFREKYGGQTYADKSATVVIDTLSIVDFPPVVEALAKMFEGALTPLVEIGVMPIEKAQGIAAAAWLILLQALGVENAEKLSTFGDDGGQGDGGQDDSESQNTTEQRLTEFMAQVQAQGDAALGRAARALEDAVKELGGLPIE
ncbi:MAG: hypothetical protein GY832_26255 [Chloroflexi bacterium]|nr:hypothetical protein [Chloroflexota bacterium]